MTKDKQQPDYTKLIERMGVALEALNANPVDTLGAPYSFYEAREAIQSLLVENDALKAEMEQRDENERRNCLNYGPCSRMGIS